MSRQVLVVRGGALSRSTGLGRAHHDLVDRLGQDLVAGYSVANVIEHELGAIHSLDGVDVESTIQVVLMLL